MNSAATLDWNHTLNKTRLWLAGKESRQAGKKVELLVAKKRHDFDYSPSLKDVADHNTVQSLLAPGYMSFVQS